MLRFAKYHGLGNDFVVIDGRELAAPLQAAAVRRLCNRHRGVGADGVLTVWPSSRVEARMQVQNADGSDSAMCGNGLRCVARYLYDSARVDPAAAAVSIEVGEGAYRCERRGEAGFRVAMGRALACHPDLPGPEAELASGERVFHAVCVVVGNPHAVIFVGDGDPSELAHAHGPTLERHPAFPHGVNVSFARARADGFEVAVFERGVGVTLACGSGATAVAAAAVRTGRADAGRPIAIHLPGGVLTLEVQAAGEIFLEGEATRVFAGEVETP